MELLMESLGVPSPAKLNLFLHITGRREDGYHNLQTVFQLIDLQDTLTFTPNNSDACTISSNIDSIPLTDNLCYRAWMLMRPHCAGHAGMHIHLEKRIPMGSGMGGGSSNAATTLLALNSLWQTQLPLDTLMEYGKRLGADVPIFILGHNAFAEGIGDLLTPIDLPSRWFVLAFPNAQVNTKTLYANPHLTRNSTPITLSDYQNGVNTENVFTPCVCESYAEVKRALHILSQYGNARMTGSGSTVFLPVDTLSEAQDIIGHIGPQLVTCLAQSLGESPLIVSLRTNPK